VANIKSAIKRAKQNEVRRLRNSSFKSKMKTQIKKCLQAIEKKDLEKANVVFKDAEKTIDKVAAKGIIHKNTAARKKSNLAKKLNIIKKELEKNKETQNNP